MAASVIKFSFLKTFIREKIVKALHKVLHIETSFLIEKTTSSSIVVIISAVKFSGAEAGSFSYLEKSASSFIATVCEISKLLTSGNQFKAGVIVI